MRGNKKAGQETGRRKDRVLRHALPPSPRRGEETADMIRL
jgi:hypothetical protein